jgi:predicted acyl esterase
MEEVKAVVADGIRIFWDVPIAMDDGVVLRADVFAPLKEGHYPAIASYGPYAKGLSFQSGYKSNWDRMVTAYPEIMEGSSNKYQNWELVDPEKWVPDDYVCVRIDSRGAGRSEGKIEAWSAREAKDFHDCIEWIAAQSWSSGKVGLLGISYYAMNQWHVASRQPPHLTAMAVWEGAADFYRDVARHGGIYCGFLGLWFNRQVVPLQNGYGDRGARSVVTGELVAGPKTLPTDVLAANREDPGVETLNRLLDDEYYRSHSPVYPNIKTPLLSSGNWGGMGLHPRGNFEGYLKSASTEKWLEIHGDSHFSPFYRNEGQALQKKFFGHFLKGEHTGWDKQPKVQLQIRHPDETFVIRDEHEWPLARTKWTKFYLDPKNETLNEQPVKSKPVSYDAMGEGITYLMPVRTKPLEITGPVAAKLFVSSATEDADLFLALRLFDPQGDEVLFIGSNDPRVPIGLGWLRASHRKLDPTKSKPYQPYHTHDELQPLEPGKPVELDIEIWPTCIVVPPGYRLGLTIKGCDYDHGLGDAGVANAMYKMSGIGPFVHNDPADRPPTVFGGKNTLHFDPGHEPYLLLPVIP